MPGSQTTQGQADARNTAPARFAFRQVNNVGTPIHNDFAAQWLAYTLPYRRFADTLAEACARLGADVDRYSFTAMDLHHLLLAGLPAHSLTLRPAHSRSHQFVTAIRGLQTSRHLHACPGCFRLERSPGGPCTHWKSAALSRRTWKAVIRSPANRLARVCQKAARVSPPLSIRFVTIYENNRLVNMPGVGVSDPAP
jgi:hypothetical protein